MSWYTSGKGSDSDKALGDSEARAKRRNRKPKKRFWMPPDSRRSMVFLDTYPFKISEHNPMVNGSSKGTEHTCPQDGQCYSCDEGVSAYDVWMYSILEIPEKPVIYEGVTYNSFKRLLPAKIKMAKTLAKKRDRINERLALEGKPETGLIGRVFEVDRDGPKDFKIGNTYEMVGEEALERDAETNLWVVSNRVYWWERKSKDKATGRDIVDLRPPLPYKYEDILAPLSGSEVRLILGVAPGGGDPDARSEGGGKYSPGDDIPF